MHIQCPDGGVCKSYRCQGRRMIVSIGDIAAGCVECGAGEFEPLWAEPLRLASTLKCSACGASYTYLELIDQIGEEAMRRANKAVDELQKKPPET
jgi:hypothetical protein